MASFLSTTVVLGLLAGLTALMQTAPVLWPGAGLLAASGALLPFAVGCALARRRCPLFFLATGCVIGLLAVEEMFVFLTTTGPAGLLLGLLVERPPWQGIVVAAAGLVGGMALLPFVVHIYPWGGLEQTWPTSVRLGAYAVFALVWSSGWRWIIGHVWRKIAQVAGRS